MRRAHVIIFTMVTVFGFLINPLVASACGGGGGGGYPPPQTRMAVGAQGMVSYTESGDPVRVRQEPGLSGTYITQLYNGATFTVIGGSQQIDNYIWWQITTPDGVTGWIAEGEYGEYYVQPLAQ
jgi:Bacterial SH3 domain